MGITEDIEAAPRTRINVMWRPQAAAAVAGRPYDCWWAGLDAVPLGTGVQLTNADAGPMRLPTPDVGTRWHLAAHNLNCEIGYTVMLMDRLGHAKLAGDGVAGTKVVDIDNPARWADDRSIAANMGLSVVDTVVGTFQLTHTYLDIDGSARNVTGLANVAAAFQIGTFLVQVQSNSFNNQRGSMIETITGMGMPATNGEEHVCVLYRELAWIDVQPRRHAAAPLGEREVMGCALQPIEPDACLSVVLSPQSGSLRSVIGTLEFVQLPI